MSNYLLPEVFKFRTTFGNKYEARRVPGGYETIIEGGDWAGAGTYTGEANVALFHSFFDDGSWTIYEEVSPANFSTRAAFFQRHIDEIQSRISALSNEFEELRDFVQKGAI